MFRKNKLAMLVGEFLGTFFWTMVVLGALRSQAGNYFVALAAGAIVALMTVAIGSISGAILNPAMTIALWSVRKLRALQALSYIIVQFAAALLAWYFFVYITKIDTSMIQHSKITELTARPLLAETFGTFIFGFAMAAAVYQRLRLGLKAVTIGGGLALGALVASLGSAAFLNPAVALGIQQWNIFTYMLGPVLGAVLGMNLYNLLFVETEIAEQEEAIVEVVEAVSVTAPEVKRSSAAKKPATKKAPAKKPVAKKAPAKKPVAKK